VIVGELSVGELSVGELSVEDVRVELDGTPLSPFGELKLDPNPLGLDADPPGLDSVPDRPLDDPVRLEDSADDRLDDTVDDIVDVSDVPRLLVGAPRLVDAEVPRRELPLLDANGVLEIVGLDGPKVGMQGGSSG
jgi:hypothetical protein